MDEKMHKRIQEETDDLAALLIRKNTDYGNSFSKQFKKYGLLSAVIRLDDKFSRVESLVDKEALVTNEAIEDTIIDIAGYAILTLIEMKNS